jgi:6-phospho-beta-glucosidase
VTARSPADPGDGLRIVVLGGGSPFTAGLVDALAAEGAPAPAQLILYGRTPTTLDLVVDHARAALAPSGWRVAGTVDLRHALAGADVVVNQIRFGGLAGRRRDERVAADLGVPADETLGPAGLAAAIRIAPGHRDLARAVTQSCPDALVLNLTNPLSCSTALLHGSGVQRIAGLCELPLVTAQEVSRILGVPLAEVEWAYAGLNHRGFIHRFEHRGRDLIAELPDRLGDRSIGGVTAAEIASVGAIPMKHFALFRPPLTTSSSRVEILRRLRRTIVEELRADPTRSPPSLRERSQPWYPLAVVPMLSAVTDPAPRRLVVNLPSADGIVREMHAAVSVAGIVPEPVLPVPQALARRLDRSTEHERRILAATADPTLATIRAALDADPLVPPPDVDAFARRVYRDVRTPDDRGDSRGERLGQAPAATNDSP